MNRDFKRRLEKIEQRLDSLEPPDDEADNLIKEYLAGLSDEDLERFTSFILADDAVMFGPWFDAFIDALRVFDECGNAEFKYTPGPD